MGATRDEDKLLIAALVGELLPFGQVRLNWTPTISYGLCNLRWLRWLLCLPGIGLEWIPPPYPEHSQLDDWFLGLERRSQLQSAPVPFFQEVHKELTNKPFIARTRFAGSSALTTLDSGRPGGTPVFHQLRMRLQCTCTL